MCILILNLFLVIKKMNKKKQFLVKIYKFKIINIFFYYIIYNIIKINIYTV